MKTWQQLLRDNDPGVGRMDAASAARMRTAVVRAAASAGSGFAAWPMRVALAAFACVVLMMSVLGTHRPLEGPPQSIAGAERRQIQFATPGGTRIIWEINPDFTLGEVLP